MTNKKRFLNLNKKTHYILFYTLIFLIIAATCWNVFFFYNKAPIKGSDGWDQHLKALIYYSTYLKEVLRTLFIKHSLHIPQYTFGLGYGGDILTTLHYYVIGDPFSALSVFATEAQMPQMYTFLVMLRLYLAGLSFYVLMKRFNHRPTGILLGSLIYCFSGFTFLGVCHPYFINPMIYMPLMMLGIEKVIHNEKPYLFILMVFLSEISNFYFYYMIVLLTVLYALWRLISLHKTKVLEIIKVLLRLLGYSLIGVLMGAVVLLPVIMKVLNDSRSSTGPVYTFFYPLRYYRDFVRVFVDATQSTGKLWTRMGYGGTALLSVFILFVNTKRRDLKVAFVGLTAFLLIPICGYTLNGFAYVTNRWIWFYSLMIASVVTVAWEKLFDMNMKKLSIMFSLVVGYLLLLQLTQYKMTMNSALQISLMFAGMCGIIFGALSPQGKRFGKIVICASTVGAIMFNATNYYSYKGDDYALDFLHYDTIAARFDFNAVDAINKIAQPEGFVRYTPNLKERNMNLIKQGYSSTQYYWSLSNPYLKQFMGDMKTPNALYQSYNDLDHRTILNSLMSVKYMVSKRKVKDPGFSEVGSITPNAKEAREVGPEALIVYENKNALPLGYTYNTSITEENYNELSSVQKQEAILDSAILESSVVGLYGNTNTYKDKTLDYEISTSSKRTTVLKDSIVVLENNGMVTLTFKGIPNEETYLHINGLDFKNITYKELYSDDKSVDPNNLYTPKMWKQMKAGKKEELRYSDRYLDRSSSAPITITGYTGSKKTTTTKFDYYTKYYNQYCDKHDFTFNLGSRKKAYTSVTIKFSKPGVYSYDQILMTSTSLDTVEKRLGLLKENVLEDVKLYNDNKAYATSKVTGKITVDGNKILVMTIPYDKGWRAYVDGKKTNILRANTAFMGLKLSNGTHEIKLVYSTPYLLAGALLTIIGILLFIGIIVIDIRKRKKYETPPVQV